MVILGTQYAGEMKKGIFSVMHYLMPKRGILSLHSGCNVGANDDVSLFFGLSGTIPKLSRLQDFLTGLRGIHTNFSPRISDGALLCAHAITFPGLCCLISLSQSFVCHHKKDFVITAASLRSADEQ